MYSNNKTKYSLNIPQSPPSLDFSTFSLLSETESDRINANTFVSQINELKAQLEIVNEDRQRLKKENEKLKQEKNTDLSKLISTHAEMQKHIENEKQINLQHEVQKLKKECEEKDKLLNMMRSLLGGNKELNHILKENQENSIKVLASPIKYPQFHQSRLPGARGTLKTNRSISPYTKYT